MDCRDIYFSPKVKQEYYAGGNAYRKRLCEAGLTSNRDIIVIGGSAGATAPLKEIPSRIRSAGSGRGLHNPLQGVEILTKAASNAAPLTVVVERTFARRQTRTAPELKMYRRRDANIGLACFRIGITIPASTPRASTTPSNMPAIR
jgi:hypothetical protein